MRLRDARSVRLLARLASCSFVLAGVATLAPPGAKAAEASWVSVASMTAPRAGHTLTRLPDGRVLAAGGHNYESGNTEILADAEIYDPHANAWIATTPMHQARSGHGAVSLRDGRVLVFGGRDRTFTPLASAEVFDPIVQTWTPTANLMSAGRWEYAQPAQGVLLANGRVLVAGGYDATYKRTASVDLYDPASSTWIPAATMTIARTSFSLTALPGGRVLAAGGEGCLPVVHCAQLASAEVFETTTGLWLPTGPMTRPRASHSASTLAGGDVLVTGGFWCPDYLPTCGFTATAEIYDMLLGLWHPATSMSRARGVHTSTALPDGRVLVTGGNLLSGTAEAYDPASLSWQAEGSLVESRYSHRAVLLDDGQVLLAVDRQNR
jgi:hypothetical protein